MTQGHLLELSFSFQIHRASLMDLHRPLAKKTSSDHRWLDSQSMLIE